MMDTPVTFSHLSLTACCTAMPPPLAIFRPEKSSLENSGWLTSALYSVLTAGSKLNGRLASSLMKPLISRGFGIRMLSAPMRMPHMAQAVSAKMWYSGKAQTMDNFSTTGACCSAGWPQASVCSRLATMLRCVSTAPLDTPVVPPVYCRRPRRWAAVDRRQAHIAALRQRILEAHRVRQRKRRHHFLDVAHDEIDQHALGAAQHLAHAGDDDMQIGR